MDLVLGMRLHAAIMAAGRGIPFLGLSYDPKVERFCRRCGAVSLPLEQLTAEGLHKALYHLLRGRAHARQELEKRVAPMVASVRAAAAAALALSRKQGVQAALECFP
jgi:polysaccharide pyruvyl transferase WcaK-like protein